MKPKAFAFFTALVVVQGVHMFEHVVQLIQVFVFGVPDDEALGLLGYLLQFQGTEEWLHLAFNGVLLFSLYALVWPVRSALDGRFPRGMAALTGAVVLETWHVTEHVVIISNVISHGGCPCPGILDPTLGVTDTVLHFVYNAVVYACILIAFSSVVRARRLRPRIAEAAWSAGS